MRVYLAVQVLSASMIELIDTYATDAEKEAYSSLRELAKHVDRLVDIVNATHMHNGKFKGCKVFDSPDHSHFPELLATLEFFGV